MRRLIGVLLAAAACAPTVLAEAPRAGEGLRIVDVRKFGIVVQAPLAWSLIRWAQDDQAFALRLPQESGSAPAYVTCELAVAPESLDDYRKRHAESDAKEQALAEPRRKLLTNQIEPLSEKRFGKEQAEHLKERLLSEWQVKDERGRITFEICHRVINEDVLYTLRLVTDEAHFDAYRLDFDDMLASAKFSPPETGLQKLPGGFWMQREYRFALRLPPDWKPAFGPSDRALMFATGKTREVFTDNLLVLANAAQPLDLESLQKDLPAAIEKFDTKAKVASCQIVPQNGGGALEIVIQTKRGPFDITILERRFRGQKRNYEVKFTCETSEFERVADELRKSLDSFLEVAESKPDGLL